MMSFKRYGLVAALCLALVQSPAFATPRIGVSGQSASSPSVIAIMSLLRFAGADPVFLADHAARNPQRDIATLDGIVVAGNNYDIDPAIYGAKPQSETVNEMAKGPEATARARYEYQLIEEALQQRLPILGICGGMQRMNVGGDKNAQGTLRQHIEGNNQWKRNIPLFEPSDRIKLVEGSMLKSIAPNNQTEWAENSLHHQAAERVRQGFHVAAYNKDGVIEAIEPAPGSAYDGQFALGVQWHPEYGASDLGGAIFRALVAAAQQRDSR